jgi:hypothetical protein
MPVAEKVLAASNCTVCKREPDNGPQCLLKANYECYMNVFTLRQSLNMGFSPLSSTPTLKGTVSRWVRVAVLTITSFGTILVTSGRRVGKHEHTFFIFSSRICRIAAALSSHVGSVVSTATSKVCRRRMERMHALDAKLATNLEQGL